MRKLYVILFILLMSITHIKAFTWDSCIEKYKKAKQFNDNIRLSYIYLKGTKNCLIRFKKSLMQNPDPEFTVKAMSDNILMLDKYIDELIPKYTFTKNNLETVPKYLYTSSTHLNF